jgi:DNA topoisomerase I
VRRRVRHVSRVRSLCSPTPSQQRTPARVEPSESAVSAGLRYVTDKIPGITRRRSGTGFRYFSPDCAAIRDPKERQRLASLAVPPAWRDVWICPNPLGHLQATGRDARGRKQHRYHPRWRQVRDETKYDRILDFAAALPKIRRRTASDLAATTLSRQKVIAAVVLLLEKTLIRVGNDEYARDNNSFGLTTLKSGHASISGTTVRFRFKGKSGKFHDIAFTDARLARIVRRCQELPGRELFQYVDEEGQVQDIGSADVNEYVRQVTGQDFTAKDFRTWAGTVLAARALCEMKDSTSATRAKRNVLVAIDAVAGILNNTRSVCRKCYVHPAIIDAYIDRSLGEALARPGQRVAHSPHSLSRDEMAVLSFLQSRLRSDTQRKSA